MDRKRSIPAREERCGAAIRADLISRLAAVIASLASTFDGVQRVRPSFVFSNSTIEIARNTHGGDVSTVLDK